MKTVFLTGGATGIGREIAKLFYDKGYNLAFIDNNRELSEQFTNEWDSDRFLLFHGDVTSKDDIREAVKCTLSKFDRIDTLILNAGIHRSNNILSIEDDELEMMLNVNVFGYINTLREVLPSMINQGGGSIVVNVSDQAFIAKGNSFGYGLTKGAIASMVRSVAVDYGKDNISISGVCAGTIDTPLATRAFQNWADKDFDGDINQALIAESQNYPVGRIGAAKEVAEMFYFLSNAPFVSGSLHLIDGGLVAGR